MIRALIVDDEPLARDGIRAWLEREDDVEIVGEAADGAEAVEAIVEHQPDLVFLDVHMPGADGFDVVEEVAERGTVPVVVFVTAYDEYALDAFEAHALDYVMKPVTAERFRTALDRARAELDREAALDVHRRVVAMLEGREERPIEEPDRATGVETGPEPGDPIRRFTVKTADRYVLIDAEDVDWIQAAGNYMELHVKDRKYLIRETLKDLEKGLDPNRFARIHRSTIVNLDRVSAIHPFFHGDFEVELEDGTMLRMSRTYRDAVLE